MACLHHHPNPTPLESKEKSCSVRPSAEKAVEKVRGAYILGQEADSPSGLFQSWQNKCRYKSDPRLLSSPKTPRCLNVLLPIGFLSAFQTSRSGSVCAWGKWGKCGPLTSWGKLPEGSVPRPKSASARRGSLAIAPAEEKFGHGGLAGQRSPPLENLIAGRATSARGENPNRWSCGRIRGTERGHGGGGATTDRLTLSLSRDYDFMNESPSASGGSIV